MKPNLRMPAATQMRPVKIESIPASAIGSRRIPGGQRQHDGGDDPRQRGVRSEDEDAAGTKEGIGDQRDQRGIEPGDGRKPGRLRIGHPDGHQDGRQDEPGDDVLAEPLAPVVLQDLQSREPAQDAFRRGVCGGRLEPRLPGHHRQRRRTPLP